MGHAGLIAPSPRIEFRPIVAADCETVFVWRNDPLSRAMSEQTGAVPYAEHCAWFEQSLGNPDRQLLMATLGAEDLAVLRFDITGKRTDAIISINMGPGARGRKLATPIIDRSVGLLARTFPEVTTVFAYVKPVNIASQKAFTRAAFTLIEQQHGMMIYRRTID